MRLLHAKGLRVVEVRDDAVPIYAILSHTWEEQEITYQDLQPQLEQLPTQPKSAAESHPQISSHVKSKKGFLKIEEAARRAIQDGYEYIWIDTCCIDKSSSAELSEAINSMYRWYQEASICYVFLSDVAIPENFQATDCELMLSKSRWFTRGWTLQELIAPFEVEFYSAEWKHLGNKGSPQTKGPYSSLVNTKFLSKVTGINEHVLTGGLDPQYISVATRMSWAALRRTTRIEDIAYCLLGIFSVNMPLLYGEGSRAFIRLQEAIMRETEDQSIFAWTLTKSWPHRTYSKSSKRSHDDPEKLHGLLADSPLHFLSSKEIRPLPPLLSGETMPTAISSQGVHLRLYLRPITLSRERGSSNDSYAVLDCNRIVNGVESCPAIYLRHLWGNQYARIFPNKIELVKPPGIEVPSAQEGYKSLYVRQKPVHLLPDFVVNWEVLRDRRIKAAFPPNRWDPAAWVLKSDYSQIGGVMGIICIQNYEGFSVGTDIAIVIGIQSVQEGSTRPWCCPVALGQDLSLRELFEKLDTDIREGRETPQSLSPFSGTDGTMRAQVKEIVRHGRVYISLTICDVGELGSYHYERNPASGFCPRRETVGPKNTTSRLERILRAIVVEHPKTLSSLDGSSIDTNYVSAEPIESLGYTEYPHPDILDETELDWDYALFGPDERGCAKDMVEACQDGNLETLIKLGSLRKILQIRSVESYGFMALYRAILNGNNKIITYLLKQGDFRSDQGYSSSVTFPGAPMVLEALHRAAATQNTKALSWLLSWSILNGGKVAPLIQEQETSLSSRWTSPRNYFDIHQRSIVWHVAASGFSEGIRRVQIALNIPKEYLDEPDESGLAPVHIACRQGHSEAVRSLLAIGADGSLTTVLGLTPAHFAAFFGNEQCLNALGHYDAKIDLPAVGLHGLRPLHLAALRGHMDCTEALVRLGANKDALGYVVFQADEDQSSGNWLLSGWRELDDPFTPMEMALGNEFYAVADHLK